MTSGTDNEQAVSQMPADDPEQQFSIGDLAAEFELSTRAIRFYESKGLIRPKRVATRRVYSRRDRARLLLILRGKRLGFSLDEVAEYLQLYDEDPSQTKQISHLLEKIERSIDKLERQRDDLDLTLGELDKIRKQCLTVL